jgi:hypothetical protein
MYTCPVCFCPALSQPPSLWYICPCCGVEFENDDARTTHFELRIKWMARGCPWFSAASNPPIGWNPQRQIALRGTIDA